MWRRYNPNPEKSIRTDCVIRALCKVFNETWENIYMDLSLYGLIMHDKLDANRVWGRYLKEHGYTRELCEEETVKEFCAKHQARKYVLAIEGHVVAVESGDYFDTWDSGCECPIFYWRLKDE